MRLYPYIRYPNPKRLEQNLQFVFHLISYIHFVYLIYISVSRSKPSKTRSQERSHGRGTEHNGGHDCWTCCVVVVTDAWSGANA